MVDRKKVINELRFQLDSKEVKDQHYPVQLSASDANAILALLKEQEAVKPKIDAFGHPYCPKCKVLLYETWEFCPHCGQAVKWDE